jgi:hypothetical protein
MKNTLKIFNLAIALVLVLFVGTAISSAAEIPMWAGVGGTALLSLTPQVVNIVCHVFKIQDPLAANKNLALFAGIAPEIWLNEIMEDFRPDDSFITQARNLDPFVSSNNINLAEAGVDPDVLENNTTYPIPMSPRSDTPHSIPLETHDTVTTVVTNLEAVEASYDKMASVVLGHKNALRTRAAVKAAWRIAPAADGIYTPVLVATGETVNGLKMPKLDDIISLESAMNLADMPADRTIVFSPLHWAALVKEDVKLFKDILMKGRKLFGFTPYMFSKTPVYHKSTGAKMAYRAAATNNDAPSTIAFVNSEFGIGIGDYEVFTEYKCTDVKGDKINFQQRIFINSMRGKGVAAIRSVAP